MTNGENIFLQWTEQKKNV